MKSKKTKIILVVSLLVVALVFFLSPIIPDDTVFMSAKQKQDRNIFCSQHGCGVLILITPYEYIKRSVVNILNR
jgi:hypothetical protein